MSGRGLTPAEIAEIVEATQLCDTVAWIMFGIASLACALRVYVRAWILRKFGWDDVVMLLAILFFTVDVILTYLVGVWCQAWYAGEDPVPQRTLELVTHWGLSLYTLTVVAIKISLALFMLNTFGRNQFWERMVILSLTILPAALGIAAIVLTCATCAVDLVPVCEWRTSFNVISLAFSIANSVADIAFAFLSILILLHMTMTNAAKASAILLFLVGATGSIASILRVANYFDHGNETMQHINYAKWSMVEAGTCITAVCLFTLRPLFRKSGSLKHLLSNSGEAGQGTRLGSIMTRGHVAALQTHGLTERSESACEPHMKTTAEGIVILVSDRVDSRYSNASVV